MHSLTINHWKAMKRILHYIKGTINQGLLFAKNTYFRLLSFADADCGADIDDRRSIIGYCVYLGRNLIVWKCNKQQAVNRSSIEVEFRTLAAMQSKLVWTQNLLHKLNIQILIVPIIYCDNQSTYLLATNPILHNKFKHFELDLHFVREHVTNKKLYITHIPVFEQVVYIFTKTLVIRLFNKFKHKFRVISSSPFSLKGLLTVVLLNRKREDNN
ncbi:hypothetical protein AHAS_Ahas19G0156600 [Arachis hypogaea]